MFFVSYFMLFVLVPLIEIFHLLLCLSPNLSFMPFIFRIDMKWTYKSLNILLLGIFHRDVMYYLILTLKEASTITRERSTCSAEISESSRGSSSLDIRNIKQGILDYIYICNYTTITQYFYILLLPKKLYTTRWTSFSISSWLLSSVGNIAVSISTV